MEIDSYLSEKQRRRKKRRRYFYFAFAGAVIYFVLFSGAWVLFRSPLFRMQKMVVQGNKAVPSDDVVTLLQSAALRDHNLWKALLGFRSMLIWPDSLSAADLAFIPRLSSVTLSRDYFDRTVIVNVTERQPFAIWCFTPGSGANGAKSCYWFDNEGILFGKTYDTEGNLLFSIHDYSQPDRGLEATVLPVQFVPELISIINTLKASGVDVKEIALQDIGLQEIDVNLNNGPSLYFSLRFPADEDLAVLQSLITKPGFDKLQYVDFRVENRAYYK